jgi:electron transfer flavoprotein alpha subunit
VNGAGDSVSGPGAAAPTGAAGAPGGVQPLLVVVEPPAAGDAAAAAARVALAAEAIRLAAAQGGQPRLVTWPSCADMDFPSLATSVAAIVRSAGSAAVLVQDGDAGRQLAPLIARQLGSCAVLHCSDARAAAPSGLTFVKPVYGGWLEQEVRAAEGFIPVATLDLAGLEPPEAAAQVAAAALARVEVVPCAAEAFPAVRHLETIPPDAR